MVVVSVFLLFLFCMLVVFLFLCFCGWLSVSGDFVVHFVLGRCYIWLVFGQVSVASRARSAMRALV